MNEIVEKSSTGHKIGSTGGALTVLCFFLPWILVSCGGQKISMSGWQLAAGTTVGQGYYAQSVPGKPIIFLVLIAAIAAIVLAYMAWKRGVLTPTMDGYSLIGLGIVSLLILYMQFSGEKERAAQMGALYEYQIGIYGVVIGNIAMIIGGVVNLKYPIVTNSDKGN